MQVAPDIVGQAGLGKQHGNPQRERYGEQHCEPDRARVEQAPRNQAGGQCYREENEERPKVSTQVAQTGHGAQREQLDDDGDGQHDAAAVHAANVIIPALNEEQSIAGVIGALRAAGFERIIVVDNGSGDRTAQFAEAAGARVVREGARGYGAACQAGIAALADAADSDVVAFMDADGSDDARDLHHVIAPLLAGTADLVIGSRTRGVRERGALPAHARAGNRLASWLIELRTGHRFGDPGPMRALRYGTLERLGMKDRDFGWTIEMQLKAARARLRIVEVPVSYRRRIGQSKISGTVSGSVRAGAKILLTIARNGR